MQIRQFHVRVVRLSRRRVPFDAGDTYHDQVHKSDLRRGWFGWLTIIANQEIRYWPNGTLSARKHPKLVSINLGATIMGSTFNGLIGLIILVLDIWAIINVLKSGAEVGMKVLWVLLILLLPVLGLIIWAIAGPRGNVRL
jgi:hypothetical protein